MRRSDFLLRGDSCDHLLAAAIFPEQQEEKWPAQERGEDADGKKGAQESVLGEETRGCVGEGEECCAGGSAEGEKFALIVSGDDASDVRGDEADKSDRAADGHGGGGHQ